MPALHDVPARLGSRTRQGFDAEQFVDGRAAAEQLLGGRVEHVGGRRVGVGDDVGRRQDDQAVLRGVEHRFDALATTDQGAVVVERDAHDEPGAARAPHLDGELALAREEPYV